MAASMALPMHVHVGGIRKPALRCTSRRLSTQRHMRRSIKAPPMLMGHKYLRKHANCVVFQPMCW